MFLYIAEQLGFPGIFNLFRYITFRAGAATATALLIGLIIGPRFIGWLRVRQGKGQPIRDDGPQSHLSKRGTPTMGGLMILTSITVSMLLWMDFSNRYLWACLFITVGFGLIGFLDDYDKVTKRSHKGVSGRTRLLAEFLVAGIGSYIILRGTGTQLYIPFYTGPVVDLGLFYVLFASFVIVAFGNAVNLTDGLDGLATGASTMVFGAYTLVNIWQNNQSCVISAGPKCYEVRDPLDLAVIAAALTGACFGFLWWNASPAKIFMGDTGSLALGGALAGLAILTRTEFLLAILGGLFVIITFSVILQVGYFKLSGGKRIFRMAPLQHHFELKGWAEITIVIRFWIITGLCVAAGLGIFYAEWVAGA